MPAVPTGPIDSHCHLQLLPPNEREAALDAARERGVCGFLVPAIRLDEAETLLHFSHQHADVWCALGVHPHAAASWQPGDEKRLAELLQDPKVVAVGECGLDFYYDHAPREQQIAVLRQQFELALGLDLPVIVHNRDSNEEMLAVIRRPELTRLSGDFHSFAGGLEMGRELAARGFHLGMSGLITFKRADNVRAVLPFVPQEQLLVETDTPYLAPIPYRGQPNCPAYVVEIAARLAQELNLSLVQICEKTSENFFRLFQRAHLPHGAPLA